MVNRVVATKLTEDEHDRLLNICNREGCTPSSYIKEAVLGYVEAAEVAIADGTHDSCINQKKNDVPQSELAKFLGMKK